MNKTILLIHHFNRRVEIFLLLLLIYGRLRKMRELSKNRIKTLLAEVDIFSIRDKI